MKYRISKGYPHLYLDRGGRKDQDGIRKERWRYRPPGGKAVTIHGKYGSPEFAAAYRAAVEGRTSVEKSAVQVKNTMKALVESYRRSAGYHGLKPSTRECRDIYLRYVLEKCGDLPVAKLERKYVRALMAPYGDRPGATYTLHTCISVLMNHAIEEGLREDNPVTGIKRPKLSEEGHHCWAAEECAQFETFYPIGTMPRLAYSLLLYTGQRVGDVNRMGPQHVTVKDGRRYIAVRQQKTGADLLIPIWPPLQEALDATPSGHMSFIIGEKGRPLKTGRILGSYSTGRPSNAFRLIT